MVDQVTQLGALWRSVYRKAGAVAQDAAAALLRDHVYLFHRTAVGGGGTGEDTGPWVDEAGDTMTGALVMQDTFIAFPDDPDATGAVSVVYGGTPPAPNSQTGGPYELGVRFSSATALALVQVRWNRAVTATTTPTAVRLWDTTTGLEVWSTVDLAPFADPATGWKTVAVAPGAQYTLVAGREYVLSLSHPSGALSFNVYTPVPDAPLTFVGHRYATATGVYPTLTASAGYLDPGLAEPGGAPVAQSGALRLRNGTAGAIAWRNAADTGDHTLYVTAAGELVFDGVAIAP